MADAPDSGNATSVKNTIKYAEVAEWQTRQIQVLVNANS